MSHIDSVLTVSRPKARATLVRILEDIDYAEDALQWASLQACKSWQEKIPDNPVAWLVTVGRNHFIDEYRKHTQEKKWVESSTILSVQQNQRADDVDLSMQVIDDDVLRLIFTCCHPVLKPEAQTALTLRVICDLSVEEIARAFLVPKKTMEKRITRAKEKIREGDIPYELPAKDDMSERKSIVLSVVYLIFNEGHLATSDRIVVNENLCKQAILLGRKLIHLFPSDMEVAGLLSLMLLLHARNHARLDQGGQLVTLEEQDRAMWDRSSTDEAMVLLEMSLRKGKPGPYQIQAGIAAIHNQARRFAETDWKQIAYLYQMLEAVQPSKVVTLNRIVAVCHAEGVERAWSMFCELNAGGELISYAPYYGVKAQLLERREKYTTAIDAYKKALSLTKNPGEKLYISNRINELNRY